MKICKSDHACNGEDEEEALSALHVQVSHCCELFGTSRIQNLQHALLSIYFDLLSIGILNGRVVFLDVDRLDKLNGLFKRKEKESIE